VANHLIIGLGGTGGRIIRSFRKLIYQKCRAEDPQGVSLRYLYVDASDEMMGHNDPTWKILGTSVQLKRTSQLLIHGLNLGQVLDSVSSFPGIAPWLGNREKFRSIGINAESANLGADQKRRLGRFLFACKIKSFREQVQELTRDMQTGAMTETTFHVCAGLAGGTGSGTVVDAVAQLRAMYPDIKRFRIVVYGLLPEKDPPANKARQNYHANGYAALLELNALAVGAYCPFDVAAASSPERLTLDEPFNACYLFTDENEAGNRVDIDNELPNIVASFLYQKTVAAREFSWDSLRRQEHYENMSSGRSHEVSPSARNPERCRLFFAFGVKQIAYPEEEIREYLTYEFARQATLQLRYNHWSDSAGFLEESVNQSFSEFVKQKETLEGWRITDDHFCLSIGILPDEMANKRWKPINTFWNDLLPNFKSHIRESFREKKVWLDELSKLCETAFGQNYRDLGVRKFYETKGGDIRDHVREIRRRIEADLFADWKHGARSMLDITRLLSALITTLDERLGTVDDRVARARENEQQAESRVAFNRKEWSKIGWGSELMGKRDRMFDAQGECLSELYIHRTRIHGWQFAKRLLEALKAEMTTLEAEVTMSASMVADVTGDFRKAIDARCSDQGSTDLSRQVVRFYDPSIVRDFSKRLVKDKSTQAKQCARVREALGELMGEDQRFTVFNQKITRDKFTDVLESTCEESAVAAHNDLIAIDPAVGRVLKVNIVERLHRQFANDREALRDFVNDVVGRARTFLPLEASEVGKTGPGIPPDLPNSSFTIILPETQELKQFTSVLVDEFRNAKPGPKEVILHHNNSNEITLVEISNLLPARFVRDAEFLRRRYEARVRGTDGDQARFELHGEGDGMQFPSLFVRSVGPKDVLPYLLLARAMNVIQQLENPETGVQEFWVVLKDPKGNEKVEPLAPTLDDALEKADAAVLDWLESIVGTLLAGDYLHKAKRETLVAAIQVEVDTVKARVKSPLDKTYRFYVDAAERAETLLVHR